MVKRFGVKTSKLCLEDDSMHVTFDDEGDDGDVCTLFLFALPSHNFVRALVCFRMSRFLMYSRRESESLNW